MIFQREAYHFAETMHPPLKSRTTTWSDLLFFVVIAVCTRARCGVLFSIFRQKVNTVYSITHERRKNRSVIH